MNLIKYIFENLDQLPIEILDQLVSSYFSWFSSIYEDTFKVNHKIKKNSTRGNRTKIDYNTEYDEIVRLCPSLKSFISYIKDIPPMQKNEYKKLQYDLYHYGSLYSKNRMIDIFLHVAVHIAFKQAVIYDIDIENAIGSACVGLIMSTDKCWQYDNASTFRSYASKVILQNILYEQVTQRSVYYPIPQKIEYSKIYPDLKYNGCIECSKLFQCKIAKKIVIDKLKCDEKNIFKILLMTTCDERYGTIIDLLKMENQENKTTDNLSISFLNNIEDIDTGYEMLCKKERIQIINQLLDKLSPKEARVIRMKYGLNYYSERKFEDISREFNVTSARIRQIHKDALYKLRRNPNIQILGSLYYDEFKENINEKSIDLIDELIKGHISVEEEKITHSENYEKY